MKVKFTESSIEITKTFAEKASHIGTREYCELREVMRDLPDFQVVIKTVRRKKVVNESDRITYARMMDCMSNCDHTEELMAEFMELREYGCNYGQIRKWFMSKFSEFNNFAV